ncbi:TetR/AcrR family transcriptional regulator [Peribacillus kribbensis]|uniref:TetR/AcrR family transcriptional regulator n=1 Tax=Peribacillus kribbensis TaxID=356658 RepID=UPI0003FAF9EA|nr:TetR/AcrR family transcriptional regulator [Peribacillus kribbensis]
MPKRLADKDGIVKEALAIAKEKGMDAISLGEIAKRIGIKTPSLYNHIAGINGLKKELAVLGLTEFKNCLLQAVIGKSGDEAIYSLSAAYLSFVRTQPQLYEATMGYTDFSDDAIKAPSEAILSIMYSVLGAYHLSEEHKVHAIRGLRSLLHGFAYLELKHQFQMNTDLEESREHIIRYYLEGLKEDKKSLYE